MEPGKWYVTIAETGEPVGGPYDTDKEANIARTMMEQRDAEINLWVTMWDRSKTTEQNPEEPEWYASTNGEHYTTGPFKTREDAIREMLVGWDEDKFSTGRGLRLTLEDIVHVNLERIEEHASEAGYEIVGEYIEGWGFTGINKQSCQKAINEAVIRILRDHGVCDPSCYRVVDVQEYNGAEVESKTDESNQKQ